MGAEIVSFCFSILRPCGLWVGYTYPPIKSSGKLWCASTMTVSDRVVDLYTIESFHSLFISSLLQYCFVSKSTTYLVTRTRPFLSAPGLDQIA